MAKPRVIDRDLGFADVKRAMQESSAYSVKVGVLQSAGTYEDEHGKPVTVAQVAAWNEYGTSDGKVPSRPAFRLAADENRAKIAEAQSRLAQQVLDGKIDTRTALGRLGLLVQGYVRKSIIDLRDPPNAPFTIKQKGSSNPLVDSGQLVQSVTWEVVKSTEAREPSAAGDAGGGESAGGAS